MFLIFLFLRIFLGEELNALGIKDLQSIEKQLERTLAQARKHQVFIYFAIFLLKL
jgi:hypothetical protein